MKITIQDSYILNENIRILGASELMDIKITYDWIKKELEYIKEKKGIDFLKKYSIELLEKYYKDTHKKLMQECISFYKEQIEYLKNTITVLY